MLPHIINSLHFYFPVSVSRLCPRLLDQRAHKNASLYTPQNWALKYPSGWAFSQWGNIPHLPVKHRKPWSFATSTDRKIQKKPNPKHYFNSYPKHEDCKEVFSVFELQNMHVCISMWPPTYTSMNNKSIIDRDSFQHQLSYAGSYVSHSGCTYSPACFSFFQYLHLIWPRKKGAQIMAVFIFSQLSETN